MAPVQSIEKCSVVEDGSCVALNNPGGHNVLWILELRDESRDSTHLKMTTVILYRPL